MRDIRSGKAGKKIGRRTTPQPPPRSMALGAIGERRIKKARPSTTPQPQRKLTKIYGRQVRVSSPTSAQVRHAQTQGFDPGSPGPFASPQDAARAAAEARFHAPRTVGELGRRTTELATGVDPAHPLRNELFGSGVGNLAFGAASFLPIIRGPRAAIEGVRAARAARSVRRAEEVERAARPARKIVKPGTQKLIEQPPPELPEKVKESASKITNALRGAKALRRQQGKLYREERSRRSGAAMQAMHKEGGVAGFSAGKEELKGQLPKLEFNALKDKFGQQEVDDLFTHVQQHEGLRPFEKIRTQTALKNAFEGQVPTRSEHELLSKVFGPQFAQEVRGSVSTFDRLKNAGLEIANIPRSLMASFDVSAPFRQGLIAGVSHPAMFFRNFVPMFKALGSERAYNAIMDDIASRPSYELMQRGGLSLTDLGSLSQREEQFISSYAEKIPGAGIGVRASGRAYTSFLNKMRADMFDHLTESATREGINTEDDQFLKSLSTFINSATGRGDLGKLQNSAVILNSVFFSPRLLASRINFLNPMYYAKLDPFARKEALKGVRNLIGTVGAFLMLAKMAGADVNPDPRNADWAKIKIGNTRIDLLGGFQQPVRLIAQVASGKVISSTTGDVLSLGPGFGSLNRQDIIKRFFEGKLAPTPSMVNDWMKGSDFQGQPFNVKRELIQHTVPLMLQDAFDLYKDRGSLPVAAAGYAVGSFGVGMQTYGDKSLVNAKQAVDDFVARSKHLGLGQPPPKVLHELRQKKELDRAITNGMSYVDKARKAAVVYDHMNGTREAERHLPTLKTEKEAEYWYLNLRKHMFSEYKAWNRQLDHHADQVIEGKTTPSPIVNAPLVTPGKIITPPLVQP
jgi:hypothetical protein